MNEYEQLIVAKGFQIAAPAGVVFRHNGCGGEMRLTRTLAKGETGPAHFMCDACAHKTQIYPHKSGGVQPALNMKGSR